MASSMARARVSIATRASSMLPMACPHRLTGCPSAPDRREGSDPMDMNIPEWWPKSGWADSGCDLSEAAAAPVVENLERWAPLPLVRAVGLCVEGACTGSLSGPVLVVCRDARPGSVASKLDMLCLSKDVQRHWSWNLPLHRCQLCDGTPTPL